MHELLPEAWDVEVPHGCCPGSRRQLRRAPVQDILLWTECFSSLVAILGSAYPQHIADFMAYQRCIVRASQIFEGNAWVVYDRCYRRRAALARDLNWSVKCTASTTRHSLAEHAPSHAVGTALVRTTPRRTALICPRANRHWGVRRQCADPSPRPQPRSSHQHPHRPATVDFLTGYCAAAGGASTSTCAISAPCPTPSRCAQLVAGEIGHHRPTGNRLITPPSHHPLSGRRAAPAGGHTPRGEGSGTICVGLFCVI